MAKLLVEIKNNGSLCGLCKFNYNGACYAFGYEVMDECEDDYNRLPECLEAQKAAEK